MKLDRKKLMIIGGVLLAVGIGVYFWRRKKAQDEEVETIDIDAVDVTDEDLRKSAGSETGSVAEDSRYTAPVNPLLSKIENKKVASYLSNMLSQKDIYRLRGWLDLINKERAKDPSKWGDSNGLKGEVSRIGGALYQMSLQNKKDKTLLAQSKGALWSNQILTDLKDAQ